MKFERNDPFPGERKAAKAELAALGELGQELPPKEKKPRGEGGSSRMGCGLNNYMNLEKHNCTGECNFFKAYLGAKQGVVNVRAPIKCLGCDCGLHEQY